MGRPFAETFSDIVLQQTIEIFLIFFLGDYINHSRTSRMGSANYSTEIISPD